MVDNLEIEPSLFYNQVSDSESDNLNEPEDTVNEPEEPEELESDSDIDTDENEDDKGYSEESESEDFILTIDDEDITEETVLSWKQAYEDRKSMQADYTKKQQARSDDIKKKVAEITEKELSEITALKSVLEELVSEGDQDLDELLEVDDTAGYIKEKERREKREKALEKAKKLTSKSKQVTEEQATEVHNELIEMHQSEWVKDGNATEAYENDMKLLTEYIKENSFSNEDYHSSFNARTLDAIIKAAKYDESLKAKKKTKAKLKPVMKAKKSKSKQEPAKEKSLTDYFYNK